MSEINLSGLEDYLELDKSLVNMINESIKSFNIEVLKINNIIDFKINNIYNDIDIEQTKIFDLFNKVKEFVSKMNEIVLLFNKKVGDLKTIQNECKDLNNIITRNKLNSEFETYNKLLIEGIEK